MIFSFNVVQSFVLSLILIYMMFPSEEAFEECFESIHDSDVSHANGTLKFSIIFHTFCSNIDLGAFISDERRQFFVFFCYFRRKK